MCRRNFYLLFFFILLSFKGYSATFVVTSNADSGPGTLRDALTQAAANDSTITDYINFNLPDLSETGRTIILYSQLPGVSSNLVIDGTTQPGNKFGVSDAHVQLQFQTPVLPSLSGLAVDNHHDVAIYGLYINLVSNTNPASFLYNGIELTNDKNIQIGAAGKGNVVNGFNKPLGVNEPDGVHYEVTTFPFENLIIQDNFFGIAADGETLSANKVSAVDLGYVLNKITIGGTPAEGNLFAQGLSIGAVNSEDKSDTDPQDAYATESAAFLIQNNKIGVDYNVENGIPNSSGLDMGSVDPNGHDTFDILDNIIDATNSYAIEADNIGEKITILRNYIGTDKTLTKRFKTLGLFFYGASQVALGSNNTADANYITNCNPVTVWPYTNATINKNSFFCTVGQQPIHYTDYGEFTIPVISILKIASTSISGTATPNSSVELFYSDVCNTCSAQTYFASVTADSQGKWVYNSAITGPVIASATLDENTSDFTSTSIDDSNVKITDACGDNGLGSITGIIPYSASNVKWVDASGNLAGTNTDLVNVKPGKYKLELDNGGGCGYESGYYEIKTIFQIDGSKMVATQPSCGIANGSITGLNITNNSSSALKLTWQDAGGKVWGTTSEIKKLPAGSYELYISNADKSCTDTYGPVTLKNTTGPNIDQSQQQVQPTNCGQALGAITNITATGTGTLKYAWLNSQQQTVATTPNLTGQPAGVYKLQVTDDTQCGPVYSSDIAISEINGITLNESNAISNPATCSLNDGSVTGITTSGVTTYTWVDANGKSYTTPTPDLTNVPAGTYTLTVSNTTCIKTGAPHIILQAPPTQFPAYNYNSESTCTNSATGFIKIQTDNLVKSLRWVNSKGDPAGTGNEIDNLAVDTYTLYLTDNSNCEYLYNSYPIMAIQPVTIVSGSEQINDDQCTTHTGSIKNIQVKGGITPYAFNWTDAAGNTIATTADLVNAGAGSYTLTVSDVSGCAIATNTYTLQNQDNIITPPAVNNIQLCSPGNALLQVKDVSPVYSYRLYDSGISTTPIDEQANGIFKITINSDRSFYVSRFVGDCESSRTQAHVSVGISGLGIANTITPNGDGINDYWQISNIENYPDALIQIFTRNGQKIYESKGYSIPFDGTYKGKKLPVGVYYYIINLGNKCSLLSGNLTIIR